MSAVTILTPGLQERTGASDPFDAGAFSTLRLDLTARADQGLEPICRLWLETSRSSTGPWRPVYERFFTHDHISPNFWPPRGVEHIAFGGFDRYVRLRWEARRWSETPEIAASANAQDLSLYLGLTGDGQPDAP